MTNLLLVAHAGLWVAVVVQGLAICVLFYKNNELLEVAAGGGLVGGRMVGTLVPSFLARDLRTGRVVSHEQFLGTAALLLFVSPTCPACLRLVAELAVALGDGRTRTKRLLVYCDGSDNGCADAYASGFRDLDATPLLAEHDSRVPALFAVPALPALVEVDDAWRIVAYSYPSKCEDVTRRMLAEWSTEAS